MVSTELLFAGASDFYVNLNGLPKGKYEVRVMAEDEETYEFLVP